MGVMYIEDLDLDSELAGSIPLIVDFYADWCGPCRAISPILGKLADKYEGAVKVVKVDIQENKELARQYGVSSIPYIVSLVNGKVADSIIGNKPHELEEMFHKLSMK